MGPIVGLELDGVGFGLPAMNALDILRETVRILRVDPSSFMAILAALVCPTAVALHLASALLDAAAVVPLSRRIALLAASSGIPVTRLLVQLSHHLAGAIVAAAVCFPLLASCLLLARAAAAYCVACAYAARSVTFDELLATARRIWRRLLCTYLCVCGVVSSCLVLSVALLLLVCDAFAALGYPPEVIIYPALLTFLAFSVAYAHTIIICNLAGVVTVLEDTFGPQALLRSTSLMRGQTQAGLLLFLGSTIGTAFIEGLFEHRVKTLSYGDGSSRLWEGPLLVLMYSFVVLIDSMMSAVFYFSCRSSSIELLEDEDEESSEDSEEMSVELANVKEVNI